MGTRSPWRLALFSLCFFFSSGICIAKISRYEENQELFSSSDFSTELDEVPIVNPTTPGSANPSPTVNPTSPQAPDTTGQTPPTPTTPNTNPTTPTTPNTNPTTPTAPNTNPTTPTTTPATPTPTNPGSSGGQWCIASQSASETALQVALDYACGYGGADCSALQQGASCYNPNTVRDHASYAFNDYYQKNPSPTSCVFGGTAQLTNTDPSSGNCHYASSKGQSMSPPTSYQSPPTPPSSLNPMTQTPPSLTMPGGSSVYGSEPTGSPNSAISASFSLLLFTTCALWASLLVANYI